MCDIKGCLSHEEPEGSNMLKVDHGITFNDGEPDLISNFNEENETSPAFMSKGCEPVGSTADIAVCIMVQAY